MSRAAASLVLAVALLASGCGRQQQHAAAVPTEAPGAIPAEDRLDPAEIEQWADDVFGKILAEHRVSALAIAVTQGDQVILNKGYGYADWAAKTPVLPDQTQFRIASLTKTFLGTALAQLVERGQIESLDDPVNQYLKRTQLKKSAGRDLTIWDLLTHRGGFDAVAVFPDAQEKALDVPLPGEVIAARTPGYIREPDAVSVYCNICSATLGFMVEDITGQTLEGFLRENIYKPLGMTNTLLSNVREAPSPNMVTQYAFVPGGSPVALPYPTVTAVLSYAGDMISTPTDMTKWLIAHVEAGRGDGPAILKPETFELLHGRHRGNHPQTSGFGMKFFTYDYNGEPVLEHYGSLQFRSLELMLMDKKIGIFVTMGGGGPPSPEARQAATSESLPPITGPVEPAVSHSGARALILEYFLGPLPVQKDMKVDLGKYVGRYRDIPRSSSPAASELIIEDSGEGGLVIDGLGVYRPSGPDVFTLDGRLPLEAGFGVSNRYAFETNTAGQVTRMFGHVNAGGFEKLASP